jgi:acyl-CoA synthetase (AMP-forming)/AMP-acid ligase II
MEYDRIDYLLHIRAVTNPNAVFLIEGEQSTTYAEVDRAADRVASWLARIGITTGDRVLLHGENSTQFLLAVFGILRAGAIVVPIHVKTESAILTEILQNAEPSLLLVDRQLLRGYRSLTSSVTIALDIIASLPAEYKPPLTPARSACIIYTSGSTGKAHGVVCGHRQILFAVQAISKMLHHTQEDRVLCCLPFSFDYGLYQAFIVLEAGASLIIVSTQLNLLTIPGLLHKHHITGFPLVPALAVGLLRSRLLERITHCSVRYVTNTGDMLPLAHIDRLMEQMHNAAVLPMYGLTECKRVSMMPFHALATKRGSVGLPLPGTTVELIEDSVLPMSGSNCGQLLVCGPHIMDGYWRDPEATAHRFHWEQSINKCTLYTGDLFRRDTDGYLYFLGRCETLIHVGNAVFSAAEFEQNLAALNTVAEAAVISYSDHSQQCCIHAFLVTDMPDSQVLQLAKTVLSPIQDAGVDSVTVHLIPKLPRTLNGKVNRQALGHLVKSSS